MSCLWSARLHASLCWYFAPTYQPLVWLASFSYMGRKPVVSPGFCFSASFGLRRYLSCSRPRTCYFPPSAVRRLSSLRSHNRPQRRRDVISLTLPFALRSPWKFPIGPLSRFSATLSLAVRRMNRLKIFIILWFSSWAARNAPFYFS